MKPTYLTVYLVIAEQTSWLTMEDERYLGFEPLWGRSTRRSDAAGSPAVEVGIKGKGGRSRQTEIAARSRRRIESIKCSLRAQSRLARPAPPRALSGMIGDVVRGNREQSRGLHSDAPKR